MTGTRPAEILRHLEPPGADDRALLARFAAHNDQAAFAELVRRHGPVVWAACLRVAGHRQDAEDAFQAVFLVLVRKCAAIRDPDLLGNWLYGVAVRVAMRARRASARRRAREVQVPTMPDPPSPAVESPPDLAPVLDEELAALPACYRDALVLCDLRGASREEAARRLGIPEGTLSSRLANGRKRLAARLAKRGVALSAAAIPAALGQAARAAVPPELVVAVCGAANGSAVPLGATRLARGELTMTTKLLLGVAGAALVAAGAVLATQTADPPKPTDPPRSAPVTKADPAAEAKPDPKGKVAFTTHPKLLHGRDSFVTDIRRVAWSPDGKLLAYQGHWGGAPKGSVAGAGGNTVAVDGTLLDPKGFSTRLPLARSHNFVGFAADGKSVITEQREYDLVSGFHRLHVTSLEELPARAERPTKVVDLDADDTRGYAFAPDDKTFRTVATLRDAGGVAKSLEVREVDTASGKTLRSLMKLDYAPYELSPDGKRLAVFPTQEKMLVYDAQAPGGKREVVLAEGLNKVVVFAVDGAKKLCDLKLPEPVNLAGGIARGKSGPLDDSSRLYKSFSPDGRLLVVSRGIGVTVVLNADTGESLPALEGADLASTIPGSHPFTRDGRLLVLGGTRYAAQAAQPGGRAQTVYSAAGYFLTVWDTRTGKVLKSWNGRGTVAFSPTRPLLAILEPNGEGATRLGLWDFAADVGKK